jgi:hypothetical protein
MIDVFFYAVKFSVIHCALIDNKYRQGKVKGRDKGKKRGGT